MQLLVYSSQKTPTIKNLDIVFKMNFYFPSVLWFIMFTKEENIGFVCDHIFIYNERLLMFNFHLIISWKWFSLQYALFSCKTNCFGTQIDTSVFTKQNLLSNLLYPAATFSIFLKETKPLLPDCPGFPALHISICFVFG